uniref:Uncharacterized protein n=1 Tax=Rhizophora mucronata TaxID=61149 RepID=A0A2P2QEA3_RHIMU
MHLPKTHREGKP